MSKESPYSFFAGDLVELFSLTDGLLFMVEWIVWVILRLSFEEGDLFLFVKMLVVVGFIRDNRNDYFYYDKWAKNHCCHLLPDFRNGENPGEELQ